MTFRDLLGVVELLQDCGVKLHPCGYMDEKTLELDEENTEIIEVFFILKILGFIFSIIREDENTIAIRFE